MKTSGLTVLAGTLLALSVTAMAETVTLYSSIDVGISAGDYDRQNTGKAGGLYGTMAIDNRWGGRRGLIEWDLSGIPAGATVTDAQVNLLVSTSYNWTGLPVSFYKVTTPWTEGWGMSNGTQGIDPNTGVAHPLSGATSLHAALETGTSWTTAMGDYDAASRVQTTGVNIADPVTGKNFALQPNGAGMVSMVQSWLTGPNCGLIAIFDGTDTSVHPVYSRDMGYADDGQDRPAPGAYAPQLVITYTAGATLHPGDANGDGVVDLQDFGVLKDSFGVTEGGTWALGDFTGDGAIDLQDFGVLKDHFGHTNGDSPVAAVPEPVLLPLLLAGLALRRRTRAARS